MNALDADIVVVGAGFSGVGMGIALKKAGFDSFIVLERAADVGGTWRENDYPGCACDIPSMLYSFSFEPDHRWTRMFPPRREIWDYLRRTSIKYGVHPHIRFGTELIDARYDEGSANWIVRTNRGTLRTRVFISGMGPLDKPNVPRLPGMEDFTGAVFHSSRWDHSVDLNGKDVAVIGTGASAIQFVPQIAPIVRRLSLFQRNAPWVVPKPDGPVSPLQQRLRRFPPYAWAIRTFIYWFLEVRAYGFTVDPNRLAWFEAVASRHLNRQVADPGLRGRLTPNYRIGCKRILISSDYYPALQRPNVELITSPIRTVRARSIVTEDGAEHPADAIILGTGFKATEAVSPVKIYGVGGVELTDAWAAGAEAYLGISVASFPNLFLLIGPNTGLGHNSMIFMIESQVRYVMSALEHMRRAKVAALDVRLDVQRDYNVKLQEQMKRTVWKTGCTSWYLDRSGKNTTLWPGFTFAYRLRTRRLRPARYRALVAGSLVPGSASGKSSSST